MREHELTGYLSEIKANANPQQHFCLPIADSSGRYLGSLKCIDRFLAIDPSVIEDLTEWRARYMKYFLTQFQATPERTHRWLETVVLPSNDRILFLICTELDVQIGNFGVCNLNPQIGELDNLIRGRKGGDQRLIFYSELAMLSWMFGTLGLEDSYLHVFSNNHRTIALHSSVGFGISSCHKLSMIEESHQVTYLIDSQRGIPVDFQYCRMTLNRDTFLSLHPWVCKRYPGLG